MMAFEFEAKLNPDGTLKVPHSIVELLHDQRVRVLVLLDEDRQEELEFMRLGMENFLKDDTESDAIYDQLPPR